MCKGYMCTVRAHAFTRHMHVKAVLGEGGGVTLYF